MKKFYGLAFISLVLGLVAGCAPFSPVVRIEPTSPTTNVTVANRPSLSLTVRDIRPDKTLGTLSSRPGNPPITVTPAIPVRDVVEKKVVEGLTSAGFQVSIASVEETADLVLDIESFHYSQNPPPSNSEMTVYEKIVTTGKNGQETLTKTYSLENGRKFPFGLTHDSLQQFLSDALTDGLKALLTDEAFLHFLAEKR
jgi:uncharacterized lipoprotein YajG